MNSVGEQARRRHRNKHNLKLSMQAPREQFRTLRSPIGYLRLYQLRDMEVASHLSICGWTFSTSSGIMIAHILPRTLHRVARDGMH